MIDWKTIREVFNAPVTAFQNIYESDGVEIPLWKFLEAIAMPTTQNALRQKDLCETYRATRDKSEKLEMSAIMPSSCHATRSTSSGSLPPSELTGFMQFDIDRKDNPQLPAAAALRDEIAELPWVAVCGLSASGEGVWGLIKLKHPERRKEHAAHVDQQFKAMGIAIDVAVSKNEKSLRLYSYDPDLRINPHFETYEDLIPTTLTSRHAPSPASDSAHSNLEKLLAIIDEVDARKIDFAPSYDDYMYLALALDTEFGPEGEEYFHRLCRYSEKYNFRQAGEYYKSVSRSNQRQITFGTIVHLARERQIEF